MLELMWHYVADCQRQLPATGYIQLPAVESWVHRITISETGLIEIGDMRNIVRKMATGYAGIGKQSWPVWNWHIPYTAASDSLRVLVHVLQQIMYQLQFVNCASVVMRESVAHMDILLIERLLNTHCMTKH